MQRRIAVKISFVYESSRKFLGEVQIKKEVA